MSNRAYHADPALQDRFIARLDLCAKAGAIVAGPLHWDGQKGSLVGCLIEGDDLAVWESAYGLPQWLAVVADSIAADQPSDEQALVFAQTLLAAIEAGANLDTLGSRLVLSMIDDLCERTGALPEQLQVAVRQVCDLHRRIVAGEQPTAVEWRSARRVASATTDGLPEGTLHALAKCIETAAWNPATSRSVVYDTMLAWGNALAVHAMVAFGWTEEVDTALRARLQELYERHMLDLPEDSELTVFDLLAQYHPEEDARLRAKMRLDREAKANTTASASEMLFRLLKGS